MYTYQKYDKLVKVLFKIISSCDQDCAFCSEKLFMRKKRPRLEMNKTTTNFNYFNNLFTIDSVILSGGEPVLHPEYLSILEFFSQQNIPLKIITNLFGFSDSNIIKKHKFYFKKNKDWLLYGSINSLPSRLNNSNILGLRNLLKHNIPVSIIVVVYKKNLNELPGLMRYLRYLSISFKTPLSLELRLLYVEEVDKHVIRQAPKGFKNLVDCFKECLWVLSTSRINITLWNFPICYINKTYANLNRNVEKRKNVEIIKVDKDNQLQHFKRRDFNSFFYKSPECLLCKYYKNCSGINKRYIDEFKFPKLKPIIENCV
jgi:hypothetical protein